MSALIPLLRSPFNTACQGQLRSRLIASLRPYLCCARLGSCSPCPGPGATFRMVVGQTECPGPGATFRMVVGQTECPGPGATFRMVVGQTEYPGPGATFRMVVGQTDDCELFQGPPPYRTRGRSDLRHGLRAGSA